MISEIFLLAKLVITQPQTQFTNLGRQDVVLASRSYSMEDRYSVPSVNNVFKNNILLTLKYMDEKVKTKDDIVWAEIEKPFHSQFTLNPNAAFAFHDQILPQYKDSVVKTTNAHFNFTDGFLSDGYLYGDGVCHLASFIHMVALDAGLTSVSLARHDFAKINEVPREYGVSIKYMPYEFSNSSRQNLYVLNNLDAPVIFDFNYDGKNLEVRVKTSVQN